MLTSRMNTTQIFLFFGVWAVVTALVFWVIGKYRTERSSLVGGAVFLLLTVFGTLTIHSFFGNALSCQAVHCASDKSLVDTALQFVLITWGAIGGALLAKTIEHA